MILFPRPLRALSILVMGFLLFPAAGPARGDSRTVTYLENSDHELTIFFITGKEPGNTMMIMGGIQGDEPGGYLAADLYADMRLEKGNLIVVPRANFFSIRNNTRGVGGDMNRKFNPDGPATDDDARIVAILSSLMEKSTVFLNLHEGSGFYTPEWIDDLHNPSRYGQSIIADAASYTTKDGNVIDLNGPAQRVIEEINRNIKVDDHLFHFNNHDTFSESSRHKEQRKSASYHALSVAGIPAFGIETSKEISSIETKVRYETLAINAFMREYGIVPEHPSISLPTPELDHIVVHVMGNPVPFAVKNGAGITVPSGSSIHISSIVGNYERGFSVDVMGAGATNDLNRVVTISKPTVVRVFKDAFPCGEVHIDVSSRRPGRPVPVAVSAQFRVTEFQILLDGKNLVVSAGDTLHIIRGDILEILDGRAANPSWTDFRINFVGFVGNEKVNDAEDRGYAINTGTDLIRRFSLDGDGRVYKIDALNGSRIAGTAYIELAEPRVEYLIAERSDGVRLALSPGFAVPAAKDQPLRLLSVVSNISVPPHVSLAVTKDGMEEQETPIPSSIAADEGTKILFRRGATVIDSILFRADR